MAKVTLRAPLYHSMELNTGDALERGDSPKTIIDALNTMLTELYGGGAGNFVTINPAADPHNADVGFQAASTRFLGYDGTEQFRVETVPVAVSYLIARGGSAGNMPVIVAGGAATDIPWSFAAKGGGGLFFGNGWGSHLLVDDFGDSTIAVNYVKIMGRTNGSSPVISADGADANLDIVLTPKGTGRVRFGAYVATPGTITGYIEMKDSGGTLRRFGITT